MLREYQGSHDSSKRKHNIHTIYTFVCICVYMYIYFVYTIIWIASG